MTNNIKPPVLDIKTTQGFGANNGLKILVYAPPHIGKTELISTLPKPFIIASEKGLTTLSKFNLPYTIVDTIDGVEKIIDWIKTRQYAGKYESIALDSLSFLTYALVADARNNPVKYTANGMKHYGVMQDKIIDLLNALYACDVNVYVTAWQGVLYDAFGAPQSSYPDTAGKSVQTYIVHYFDLTAHLAWHSIDVQQQDGTTAKQQFQYLQTVSANGIYARAKTLNKLDSFEPANLSAILAKLNQ